MCLQGPISSDACCIEPQPLPTVSSVCLVTLGLHSYWRWFNTLQLIRKQHILIKLKAPPPVSVSSSCALLPDSPEETENLRVLSAQPSPSSSVTLFLFCSLPYAANWMPSSMMLRCWTTWLAEMRAVSWWPLAAGNYSFKTSHRHIWCWFAELHVLITVVWRGFFHSCKYNTWIQELLLCFVAVLLSVCWEVWLLSCQ